MLKMFIYAEPIISSNTKFCVEIFFFFRKKRYINYLYEQCGNQYC